MSLNLQRSRQYLQDFDFRSLFVEELGWSNPPSNKLVPFEIEGKTFYRASVAELAGVMILEITAEGGEIPDAKMRTAIHKEICKLYLENLLIFLDEQRTQSLWYWVKRDGNKQFRRDHLYVKGQPGDLFLSKLGGLVVDIAEFERGSVSVLSAARKLKEAFDVEKVTKKFYAAFQNLHVDFLTFIEGIENESDRRWYASVVLNRLMFVYFLQRKYFLDNGDEDYLQNKLAASQEKGENLFYYFLSELFFEGFAKPEASRDRTIQKRIGKIRYLNGGLFLKHRIEQQYNHIQISDRAFEQVFDLFSRYSWNLDDTPGGKDDEINPDVLGYIFEKYINQKAFGAYYTRPEITEYLCDRTINKLVLDRANAFLALNPPHPLTPSPTRGEGGQERNPAPLSQNGRGAGGEGFTSIEDLLLHLDAKLCRHLLDKILPKLSLLDPACGSGAFLIAAMKTLIDIYAAVIGRIEVVLGDRDLTTWLEGVKADHPDIGYYIKKRIITDNLYGVDIMEEATEIAKLRLFLALVASAKKVEDLEPLPNVDFNIMAGNSLIGLIRVDAEGFDRLDIPNSKRSAPHPLAPSPTRGEGGQEKERWEIPKAMEKRMLEVARSFRKEPTPSEEILWNALRGNKLEGRKFRRQQPIGVFVVDFYCPSEKLIVEVDGGIHETQVIHDRDRQQLLESLGLRLLRISSTEVETNLPSTLQKIRQFFTSLTPLSPSGRGAGGEGVFQGNLLQADAYNSYQAILKDKNQSIASYKKHAFLRTDQKEISQDDRLLQLRDHINKLNHESQAKLNQLLLDEFSNKLGIKYEEAQLTGKPKKRVLKIADIDKLEPFHWGYHFDEVINQRGGFDAIIANPPWEIFKPQAKEFFAQHSDLVTKNKMDIKDFEKEQAKLLESPEVAAAWLDYQSQYPYVSAYYRSAEDYRNQISVVNGKKAGTDINLYKLFLERCFHLLRSHGECGIVIPSGIYTDLGTKQLREMLFSDTQITGLFCFENRKEIFEGVHRSFKFVILSFEKGGSTDQFPARFMRLEVGELNNFPNDEDLQIGVDLIRKLSPDSLSVMEFKSDLDVRIAEKILKFPMLGDTAGWGMEIYGEELHMNRSAKFFKSNPTKFPLYEGGMIWHFDNGYEQPRYWIKEDEIKEEFLEKRVKRIPGLIQKPKDLKNDYETYRLAIRKIASSTNERTLVTAVIPPHSLTGNSLAVHFPFIHDKSKYNSLHYSFSELLVLTALLNSFILDYCLRSRMTTNLNSFFLYQLPVPRRQKDDKWFNEIVQRAAKLICTTPEFDDLAKEVGLGSHQNGVTNEVERAKLRAELDGIVGHLYGLTEEEFAHILTTFPIVPDPTKQATLNAYRDVARGLI